MNNKMIPRRYCDKCNELIEYIKQEVEISFNIREENVYTVVNYTLCTNCAKQLNNWIKTKKD